MEEKPRSKFTLGRQLLEAVQRNTRSKPSKIHSFNGKRMSLHWSWLLNTRKLIIGKHKNDNSSRDWTFLRKFQQSWIRANPAQRFQYTSQVPFLRSFRQYGLREFELELPPASSLSLVVAPQSKNEFPLCFPSPAKPTWERLLLLIRLSWLTALANHQLQAWKLIKTNSITAFTCVDEFADINCRTPNNINYRGLLKSCPLNWCLSDVTNLVPLAF